MNDERDSVTSGWSVIHLTQDTYVVQNGFRCALGVVDTADDTGQEPRIVLTRDTRIETGGFHAVVLTSLSDEVLAESITASANERTWDVFLLDGDGERRVGPVGATSEGMALATAHRCYGGDVLRVVQRKV